MKNVNLFSVVASRSRFGSKRLSLLLQGHPTGIQLRGTQFVDQYSNGQRYILLTADPDRVDETLYIYLMDLELNLIDELAITQPISHQGYRPHLHPGEYLEFRYFNDGLWRLQVRHHPKSQPLNLDHFPVQRPIKLWGQQYLRLEKLSAVMA